MLAVGGGLGVLAGAALARGWYRMRNLPDTRDLGRRVDRATDAVILAARSANDVVDELGIELLYMASHISLKP